MMTAKTNRRTLWLLGLIVAAAFGLRCRQLAERSIWFDEAFSYTLVTEFPVGEMIERTGRDVHPPLYYMVLRVWVGLFGESLFAMRFLSVALGTATVLILFGFCRDLDRSHPPEAHGESSDRRRSIALTAAALLALNSMHIRWSQEMRMYALGTLLSVGTTWMMWRGIRTRRSLGYWSVFALLDGLLALTHNYALFTVAAHWCFIAWCLAWRQRSCGVNELSCDTPNGANVRGQSRGPAERLCFEFPSLRQAMCIGVVTFCTYLPWLPYLIRQVNEVRSDYWIPRTDWGSVPAAVVQLFYVQNPVRQPPAIILVVTAALVLSVIAGNLVRRRPQDVLVVLMVTVPMIAATAVSLLVTAVIVPRYFLYTLPFLLVALARAVQAIPWRDFRTVTTVVVIANSVVLYGYWWKHLNVASSPGLKSAMDYVLAQRESHDAVVVVHPFVYWGVRYYLRESPPPRLVVRSQGLRNYEGRPIVRRSDILAEAKLRNLPAKRIWVVDCSPFGLGPGRGQVLPDVWTVDHPTRRTFEEAHRMHGPILVSAYRRADSVQTTTAANLREPIGFAQR